MKKYKVNVNGTVYEVTVEAMDGAAPAAAAPAAAPAPAAAAPAGGEKVSAPMPGTILDVRVSNGQTVKKGDILFILEAMKMENEIFAPKDGTVAQIVAPKGTTVETGSPLIVLA